MKNLMKIAAIAMFAFFATAASAQQVKIGYLDFDELVSLMPEYTKMGEELETQYKSIDDERTKMMEEYQTAVKDYNENADTYASVVRQQKEQEIVQMQQRITNFLDAAQQEMENKQTELLTPIVQKAQEAIEAVGKEGGYTYIVTAAALIYVSPSAENVMDLVKKKLGL